MTHAKQQIHWTKRIIRTERERERGRDERRDNVHFFWFLIFFLLLLLCLCNWKIFSDFASVQRQTRPLTLERWPHWCICEMEWIVPYARNECNRKLRNLPTRLWVNAFGAMVHMLLIFVFIIVWVVNIANYMHWRRRWTYFVVRWMRLSSLCVHVCNVVDEMCKRIH